MIMTNIEQYINHNRVPCSQYQQDQSNPSIDSSNIEIPKKSSEYLIVDNFLSEYNTEQEKKLVMQNLLLIDSIPKENSTNLIDSGTVFRIMREGKLERDQLTELFNYLQRNKADKSELFSKKYNDLTGKPPNLSNFNNDLNFVSLEELQNQINNTQNNITQELERLIQTQEYINRIANLIEIPQPISDYNNLTNKPYIPEKVSDLINDSGYINQHQSLENYYTKQETNQAIDNKFIILTESQYEALTQYEPNVIYLITEGEEAPSSGWHFGDGFPIILGEGNWSFGQNFPIILTQNN